MSFEPISYIHFSENLRWWIEKVDGERQLNVKVKREFETEYVFATELSLCRPRPDHRHGDGADACLQSA